MKTTEIVKNNRAKWLMFGRDSDKPEKNHRYQPIHAGN